MFQNKSDFGSDPIVNLRVFERPACGGGILRLPARSVERCRLLERRRRVDKQDMLRWRDCGLQRGGLVADGTLDVEENVEGHPNLSDVTKWSLAFNGAFEFAAGFVVASELDELVGCVVVVVLASFEREIANLNSDIGSLGVKANCVLSLNLD
jgi:hypothetical protein